MIAFAGLAASASVFARGPSEEWERLEGCRLVLDDYFDGDSFHVESGRRKIHVRLYFVDTPETDDRFPERLLEQARYFGISKTAALRAGTKAKAFAKRLLAQPFTVLTRWEDARGDSQQKRYYAVVLAAGRTLQEALVEAGWARAFGMPADFPERGREAAFQGRLRQLETQARAEKRGAFGGGVGVEQTPEPSPPANGRQALEREMADPLSDVLDPASF